MTFIACELDKDSSNMYEFSFKTFDKRVFIYFLVL